MMGSGGEYPPIPRPPEEDQRELAGRVVQGLYRLVKACQLHTESNQAVAQVVEYVQSSIDAYHRSTGQEAAAILFRLVVSESLAKPMTCTAIDFSLHS